MCCVQSLLDQAGIHGTKSVIMKKMDDGPGNMVWFGSLLHSLFFPKDVHIDLQMCVSCSVFQTIPGRPSQ